MIVIDNLSCVSPIRCMRSLFLVTAAAALALPSTVLAQAAEQPLPPEPTIGGAFIQMLPMLAMVFMIFYFLVLRPQQAKLKAHQELLAGLKRGDSVVTTGGIMARVAGVEEDHVLLEIAQGVKIKVQTSHITAALKAEAKSGSQTSAAANDR